MPALKNRSASRIAQTVAMPVFQAGARVAKVGYAILSSMLFILALFQAIAAAQVADLVLVNANIYTMNPQQPKAKALAVKDGRILSIGETVQKYVGPKTTVIDAHGAAMIPGLIDSHGHMLGLGSQMETFDFRATRTVAEVANAIHEKSKTVKPGDWILGRSWDQTNWGGQFPTHFLLTKASPDNPVFLIRVDGHAAWVNRKALELAKITSKTPDPPGGKILHDQSGEPTGVLIDRAQGLVGKVIPEPSFETVKRRLLLASQECARLGLTTVHDAGISAETIKAYKELIAENKLPLRIYGMIGGDGTLWQSYLKSGPEVGDFLTIRSIKLMADGAMGSGGAAFWQPYSDDKENTGLLLIKQSDIERVAAEAVKAGFQVNTHAIGDRANRLVLDAYGKVLGGVNDKRFRIEHAQALALPDFELFKKFSVIASMQSTHATSDMRWAEKRLGPDRIAGAYAAQRFLKLGVPVANGSDFPVEEPNPILGLYAAITRQDLAGYPAKGWMPDQKLTREQALKSWTVAGAYAAFEEKQKGSLEVGKMADFLLLSGDLMTIPEREIGKLRVTMTVVGGKVKQQNR